MPAAVMTRARSFILPPHLSHFSMSISNARISSSRHGRYPERWVGGLSHAWDFQGSSFAFGLHVAQSVVQLESSSLCAVGGFDGGGGGTTRALHLLAAASTPA